MRDHRRWLWPVVRWLGVAAAVGLAACDAAQVGEGQPCSSSEECLAGLVCDFGRTPHSCQPTDSLTRDLSMRMGDAAAPDLSQLGDP